MVLRVGCLVRLERVQRRAIAIERLQRVAQSNQVLGNILQAKDKDNDRNQTHAISIELRNPTSWFFHRVSFGKMAVANSHPGHGYEKDASDYSEIRLRSRMADVNVGDANVVRVGHEI